MVHGWRARCHCRSAGKAQFECATGHVSTVTVKASKEVSVKRAKRRRISKRKVINGV